VDGVAVERIVRFGDPVEEIVVQAEAFSADSASGGGRHPPVLAVD
jgi:hypothetical protein